MILFVSLAHLHAATQLVVPGSLSRTIRWRTIPTALGAGLSAAALGVLPVHQRAVTR